MSEFKSQAEVWQSLLDGNIIKMTNGVTLYQLLNGNLHYSYGSTWSVSSEDLSDFDCYETFFKIQKKKIVRMAPALFYNARDLCISHLCYASEDAAKNDIERYLHIKFKKWLIDTPYAIDVEVEDE
jgi:hypothetical protein